MRDTETLRVSGDADSLFREKRIEVKCWAAALAKHGQPQQRCSAA